MANDVMSKTQRGELPGTYHELSPAEKEARASRRENEQKWKAVKMEAANKILNEASPLEERYDAYVVYRQAALAGGGGLEVSPHLPSVDKELSLMEFNLWADADKLHNESLRKTSRADKALVTRDRARASQKLRQLRGEPEPVPESELVEEDELRAMSRPSLSPDRRERDAQNLEKRRLMAEVENEQMTPEDRYQAFKDYWALNTKMQGRAGMEGFPNIIKINTFADFKRLVVNKEGARPPALPLELRAAKTAEPANELRPVKSVWDNIKDLRNIFKSKKAK